jgi:cytochrome oxidase Cu insertion factor (SCO1/SenC/PrrC family)
MIPKTVLVLVAIFSWVATAAITLTVLTLGPGTPPGSALNPAAATAQDGPDPASGSTDPLPRLGLVPVFSLTDQQNQPFGLNDLRGNIWVVDTIFTRCNAICPTLAGGMKQLQSALDLKPQATKNVRLISISLDGQHDTPELLNQYAKSYQADPKRWHFLTGKPDNVWPLVQDGFKLPVEPGPPGDNFNILHSGKMLLIDNAGVIRGYYDGLTQAGRIELLADLNRLLDEEIAVLY